MKNKILPIILLAASVAMGAIRYVGQGRAFTSLYTAIDGAADNDTVILIAANDSTFAISSEAFANAGVLITSDYGHKHTIQLTIVGSKHISTGGNGGTIKNLRFSYPSGTPSGISYMIDINNAGWTIKNCDFESPILSASLRTILLNNLAVVSGVIEKCYFHRTYNALYAGDNTTQIATNIVVSHCIFDSCQFTFGTKWRVDTSLVLAGGYENQCTPGSDSTSFNLTLFDGKNYGGEYLTWDGVANKSSDNTISYCYFMGETHVQLMWDFWHYGQVFNSIFNSNGNDCSVIYNHKGQLSSTSDTVGWHVVLKNVTTKSPTINWIVAGGYSNDSINDCRITKSLILGNGMIITAAQMARDSLDSCVMSNNVTVGTNFSYVSDTLKGRGYSYLVDTNIFLLHKRNSPYYWSGSGYLFTPGDTSIADNILSWNCSANKMFRHDNGFYSTAYIDVGGDTVPEYTLKNAWITGDTLTACIDTSTNKTTWGLASDTIIIADQTVSITTDELPEAMYYIRQRVYNSTYNVYDTSAIDSFTISGGSTPVDTIYIRSIYPTIGAVAGGDTACLIGRNLDNVSVTVGGTSCNIVAQSATNLLFILPAKTAGTYNVIASHGTDVPDTITYIYQSEIASDTVYVDTLMLHTYFTYNPSTRDSLSGSEKVFNDIQKAIDSTTTGMTVMLRGGRYIVSKILIGTNKNGSSWIRGHYNTLQSYPNEWAIIDGNDEVELTPGNTAATPLIGSTGVSGNAHRCYWKFKRIEVTGAKCKNSDHCMGIKLDGGPLWFDSCYIHDNKSVASFSLPHGIGGYDWHGCVVENCKFINNGSYDNGGNANDIQMLSDYQFDTWGREGFHPASDSAFVHHNIIRNNYFLGNTYCSIKYKAAQLMTGRNVADNLGPEMSYQYYGDKIYHNVIYSAVGAAIYPRQDFIQIYNNITVNCAIAAIEYGTDEVAPYKMVIYNNTIINDSTVLESNGMYLPHSSFSWYDDSLGHSHIWHNIKNNIIVNGRAYSDHSALSFARPSAMTGYSYDSLDVSRNLFYTQRTSPIDGDATRVYYVATSLQTMAEFNANYIDTAKHWQSSTAGLFTGLITDSNFVLNGDTLIKNGGIGGNHPYLPNTTLPSYIGAAITGDTWVGDVLALDSLGRPVVDPPVVTVDPVSDTTTNTVRMWESHTGDSVQIAWYRFHGSDTILMSRDSVLQFTATVAMHGDSIAAVLYNNADTVMTAKAGIYFVYAVFDSLSTDSTKIYLSGNFLSGEGWTATLSDSTLTTESGSATAQVFGYNHRITLSTNKYLLVVTNGTYTVSLWIGRRKSTGNNKPRISIDIGL